MANEDSVSRRAVRYVKEYEENNGRIVVDVQTKKEFKGFDLFSFSEDKQDIRTIEVKGTEHKMGIPDLFETEVTREKRLISTHIYVVSFHHDLPSLFIIPTKDIKPDQLKETRRYRISSTFKTNMGKYKVE